MDSLYTFLGKFVCEYLLPPPWLSLGSYISPTPHPSLTTKNCILLYWHVCQNKFGRGGGGEKRRRRRFWRGDLRKAKWADDDQTDRITRGVSNFRSNCFRIFLLMWPHKKCFINGETIAWKEIFFTNICWTCHDNKICTYVLKNSCNFSNIDRKLNSRTNNQANPAHDTGRVVNKLICKREQNVGKTSEIANGRIIHSLLSACTHILYKLQHTHTHTHKLHIL